MVDRKPFVLETKDRQADGWRGTFIATVSGGTVMTRGSRREGIGNLDIGNNFGVTAMFLFRHRAYKLTLQRLRDISLSKTGGCVSPSSENTPCSFVVSCEGSKARHPQYKQLDDIAPAGRNDIAILG